MRADFKRALTLTAAVLLLAGCGAQATETPTAAGSASAAQETRSDGEASTEPTPEPTPPENPYQAPEMAVSDYHAEAAVGENGAAIDISCVNLGYVAAAATSESRLKFQVACGDEKYNYDLPEDGTPTAFPLQFGDGTYTFKVLENTGDNKYAVLYSVDCDVTLDSEFEPFLRPSQMVDYDADSACVAKAAELAQMAEDDAGVVKQVYAYICENVAYDSAKAATVESGYLPDPDSTLSSGKGICFDYAALAAAMLRSQGIPTKLITGYVQPNDLYHAWNMIWLENEGWITVTLEAPADEWARIDLTFAASADASYTGDGTSYTDRYTY